MTEQPAAGRIPGISRDEWKQLTQRSWTWGIGYIAGNYALIISAFALGIIWPNPLSFLVSILLLGGRMLGLAILMHECAHYTLLPKRAANIFAGRWLCGFPVLASYDLYRPYHLKHHAHAGTSNDPDLALIAGYPAAPQSLRRKLWRDVSGQTGSRDLARTLQAASWLQRGAILAFQGALFGLLWLAGAPWAIALWWAGYLCIYPLLIRVRLIGEHATAPDRLNTDARMNTTTVVPGFIERLLIAPNNVSYHLEHHLAAAVPAYRLKAFHQKLHYIRYFQSGGVIYTNYRDVLRNVVSTSGQSGPQDLTIDRGHLGGAA